MKFSVFSLLSTSLACPQAQGAYLHKLRRRAATDTLARRSKRQRTEVTVTVTLSKTCARVYESNEQKRPVK